MARKMETKDPIPKALVSIAQSLELISRQIDAGLKVMLRESQGERKQIDMIRMLGELGCSSSDIANWLRAPGTSVGPILSRMHAGRKRTSRMGRR